MPAPLVNLRVLQIPTLGNTIAAQVLFLLTVGSIPFLLTLLFQDVFGWSPVKAGALVIGVFVGNIAIKPATTPMLNRFGFRSVLLVATTTLAATSVLCGLLTAATPLAVIAALTIVSGVARSTGMTAYSTIAFSDVPPDRMRDANTLSATVLMLGVGPRDRRRVDRAARGRPARRPAARRPGTPGRPTRSPSRSWPSGHWARPPWPCRLHPTAGDALRKKRREVKATA